VVRQQRGVEGVSLAMSHNEKNNSNNNHSATRDHNRKFSHEICSIAVWLEYQNHVVTVNMHRKYFSVQNDKMTKGISTPLRVTLGRWPTYSRAVRRPLLMRWTAPPNRYCHECGCGRSPRVDCDCRLLAHSGQSNRTRICPLLDISGQRWILAGYGLSAYDPSRHTKGLTWVALIHCVR